VLVHRSKKQLSFLLALLLVLILGSGCASDTVGSNVATPTARAIAQGTPLTIPVPVCHLSSCTNLTPVHGARAFTDTWENIHLFETFDFKVSYPRAIAKYYDFIWGASAANAYAYRLGNPNVMLSYYMTMNRYDGTFTDTELGKQRGLSYWKAVHPDWILYKCDRTTPAYEYQDPNMPFDFSNPAVINWQLQTYVQPASAIYGYDALAVDNVNMENMFAACGHYDANGQWVQQYSGQNVDPQWQQDVVNWLTKMQNALHALAHPMLLIANFSSGAVPLNSSTAQQALVHVDGVLDESSFTHYGEYHLPDDQWVQMVQYVQAMQQQNKPFFMINEFKNANNVSHDDIEWVLASYLMCKQRLAFLYISQIQGYGSDSRISQYSLQIGSPLGDMYQAQNVYWRDYTNGEVVVNPGSNPLTVDTTSIKPSTSFVDAYGQKMSQSFTLSAHSAKVLIKQ